MEDVLASKREENKIEGMVKNKLSNIHSGEWAEEVYDFLLSFEVPLYIS
jgi:hypothetical protein